jgi:hypothetical protein
MKHSLDHSLDHRLHLRPPNRCDDVDGIYLPDWRNAPGFGIAGDLSGRADPIEATAGRDGPWATVVADFRVAMEEDMMQVAS